MIISPRVAIVSLGVSCQTAFQIEAHAAFVGERLGCEMEKRTTPFDWLYVPVAGAAAMLRDECYFPKDVLELDAQSPSGNPAAMMYDYLRHEGLAKQLDRDKIVKTIQDMGGWRKPFWPRYGATFWHSKFDDPATFLSKAQHAADNLKRICRADRRVFIVSNTQNNIARSMREAGREPMDSRVDYAHARALHRALAEQYWPCELHVVSHVDIFAGEPQPKLWRTGIYAHRFTPDRSTWEGDGKQWRKLFEEILK